VTKVEAGREGCWLAVLVHSVGWTIGTSATQAGLAPPPSTVCSGRPLPDIAIETRLNCHILGRDALSDFFIARAMPALADLFRATAQRGFRIVYELCLRLWAKGALS